MRLSFNTGIRLPIKPFCTINKEKISYTQHSTINDIKWKKYGVDYVFECTGKFNSKDQLLPHIENGVKKVIVSAPCKMADKTIVLAKKLLVFSCHSPHTPSMVGPNHFLAIKKEIWVNSGSTMRPQGEENSDIDKKKVDFA